MNKYLNAAEQMKHGNETANVSYRIGLIDGFILGLVAGVIGTLLVLS